MLKFSEKKKDLIEEIKYLRDRIAALEQSKVSQNLVYPFEEMAEALPLLVWSTQPDGRAIYFNHCWKDYTGQSLTEAQGLGWTKVVHPDDLENTWQNIHEALQNEQPYRAEYRLRKTDNSYRWFLAQAVPVRDNEGSVLGWFGTCTDIEEQKQAEDELKQLAKENERLSQQTQEAVQMRDDFLLSAAHELRTPITSLKGYSQMLAVLLNKPGPPDFSRLRRGLDAIQRQSTRLAYLVNQLLDISRLETGRVNLKVEDCDLSELVRTAILNFNASQNMTFRIALILPNNIKIDCDKLRIEQVLISLVSNAVKYSPEESHIKVEVNTEVNTIDNSHEVQICVTDQGAGIPEEMRKHLFTRFFQVEPYSPKAGLGLSLYISKQIVELHGGRIKAEFPPEGGSRFRVFLPLKPGTEYAK